MTLNSRKAKEAKAIKKGNKQLKQEHQKSIQKTKEPTKTITYKTKIPIITDIFEWTPIKFELPTINEKKQQEDEKR